MFKFIYNLFILYLTLLKLLIISIVLYIIIIKSNKIEIIGYNFLHLYFESKKLMIDDKGIILTNSFSLLSLNLFSISFISQNLIDCCLSNDINNNIYYFN